MAARDRQAGDEVARPDGKKFPKVEVARLNSILARSAARFLKIRLILDTLGAVLLVHTPKKVF